MDQIIRDALAEFIQTRTDFLAVEQNDFAKVREGAEKYVERRYLSHDAAFKRSKVDSVVGRVLRAYALLTAKDDE